MFQQYTLNDEAWFSVTPWTPEVFNSPSALNAQTASSATNPKGLASTSNHHQQLKASLKTPATMQHHQHQTISNANMKGNFPKKQLQTKNAIVERRAPPEIPPEQWVNLDTTPNGWDPRVTASLDLSPLLSLTDWMTPPVASAFASPMTPAAASPPFVVGQTSPIVPTAQHPTNPINSQVPVPPETSFDSESDLSEAQPRANSKKRAQKLPPKRNNDIEEELTKQNLYKTEMCRSWIESGTCRYGPKCQFAHGEHEIRPVMRHPKYKTEICKTFHTTGMCPYGNRCRFVHSPSELRAQLAQATPTAVASTVPVEQNQEQYPWAPSVDQVASPLLPEVEVANITQKFGNMDLWGLPPVAPAEDSSEESSEQDEEVKSEAKIPVDTLNKKKKVSRLPFFQKLRRKK